MVRSNQLLHHPCEPALPRPAATLLLLRDSPAGPEVLMTRRAHNAGFAPGAHVFPGGVIDPADETAHSQASRRPTQSDALLTTTIAAIRESYEELGILLARHPDGRLLQAQDLRQLDRHAPLLPQCQANGWILSADQVFMLARWITDRDLPRRYDVPFLVARMPSGQTPQADQEEQLEPVWIRPAEALARQQAGDFHMIFPTIRTLERLQHYPDVDSLLLACAGDAAPLWTSCPRAGWRSGREVRFMEHETAYGELALVCPDGQLQHALDWQHSQAVPLLRNVRRLTAGNPSAMTGPGTNSYLIGDATSGYIVIDPGPADPAHQQRLWQATGGDIRMIVCTHSHADHSPGARPLQALCRHRPPILGLPSAPTARPSCHFVPDRALANGECLQLHSEAGLTHTLQVIHTPGHAANHLCLLLQEDGLLFSGDHILNGSTTIIDPPDGHMSDYLDSLDTLDHACGVHDAAFILPAHGHVLGEARAAIARLKAHRLQREARVLAAMRQLPSGTPDDWLALAYADTPPALWPLARRSLLAHQQRIEEKSLLDVANS